MWRIAGVVVLFASPLVCAQAVSPATAFDVVTIRPSKPPSYPGASGGPSWSSATQPDGYRTSNQTIWATIMIAYFPQGMAYWGKDRLSGAPAWVDTNQYDIAAKVAEADLPEWKKQNPLKPEQKTMFQQMLQSMLADRCKLVVHRVPSQISGFALVLDKHGARLAASKSDAALPSGVPLRDGGVMAYDRTGDHLRWNFFNATLSDLTQYFSMQSGGHPVQDKTGLTGRYDFALSWADVDLEHPERTGVVYSDDPNPLSHWDIGSLGLHLEVTKLPVDSLVVDHIEKPSEN